MHMDSKNDSRINWDKTAVLSWSGVLPSSTGRVLLRISVIGYTRNELGHFTDLMENIARHKRERRTVKEKRLGVNHRSSQAKILIGKEVKRMQCTTKRKRNRVQGKSTDSGQVESQIQGPTQVSSKQARTHHILH